jgi:LysM repeat protein
MTPSQTATPTLTPQRLFPVRFTATYTPVPTLTTIPLPTATPTAVCQPRSEWEVYTVVEGDTFFSIARRFDLTVEELASANCLTNPTVIYAGQQLFVPADPDINPDDAAVLNCDSPNAQITYPLPGEALEGVVTIEGVATAPNFRRYILDWLPDGAVSWQSFEEVYEARPTPSRLGTFNTEAFEPGLYWFKVVVLDDRDALVAECAIRVRFR